MLFNLIVLIYLFIGGFMASVFVSFPNELKTSIENMDATRLVKDTMLDMVDNKVATSIMLFTCGGLFCIYYLLGYIWKLITKKG